MSKWIRQQQHQLEGPWVGSWGSAGSCVAWGVWVLRGREVAGTDVYAETDRGCTRGEDYGACFSPGQGQAQRGDSTLWALKLVSAIDR